MPQRWETDTSLRMRMLVSLVLVVGMPVAFAYSFVLLMNTVGIELLRFATDDPWTGRFYVSPWLVLGGVAVGVGIEYFLAERRALGSIGARQVDETEYPDLHATVGRLARSADAPKPDVAVADSDVPNAFAVGARPSKATVAVTTGLLETLDDEQQEAVLAHEIAHVKNRDVSVMTLAYFLPSLTYLVAMGAYYVLYGVFRVLGSMRHVDDGDDAKGLVVIVVVIVVSAVCTLLVSAVFWVISYLLFRILSRYREYMADRGAATITGDPAALASALRALDDRMGELPDEDLREADGGVEALYVAPIDDYQFGEDRELLSSDLFPDTHPPVEDRIERLRDYTAEVET